MEIQSMLDSVWVLFSAFLVFFMHAGFALVEVGFCQRKNAVVVLTKNLAVISLASILFFLVGFGVMFGDGNSVIGMTLFAPGAADTSAALPSNMPLYVFLFFQMVFAATAATIVSGAVAERVKLGAFLALVVAASVLIYPAVGHWVWGGGFLSQMGFHDFAGSTVVHVVGGAMALAGVIIIGPRLGKYGQKGEVNTLPAHNIPMAALGVLILWLGWFGFNGGSTLSANPEAIGPVILSTNLAASAGLIAALTYVWARGERKLDLGMGLNGALAGLVAITAGADVIGPVEAIIVGSLGALLMVEAVRLMDRFQLDDPVGAIPVHFVAGLFGTIAVGLFAQDKGLLHGGGAELLGVQALGALAGAGFAFGAAALVWYGAKLTIGVRVQEDHEIHGLDQAECGMEAYDLGLTPASLPPTSVPTA